VRGQRAAAAEVDDAFVGHRPDPYGIGGLEFAEQAVEAGAVHHAGASHQPGRLGEVSRPLLVYDDLGLGVEVGHVPDSTGVVEVNMRNDHGGQIGGADAEVRQCIADDRG
jgi:hypothetical protein